MNKHSIEETPRSPQNRETNPPEHIRPIYVQSCTLPTCASPNWRNLSNRKLWRLVGLGLEWESTICKQIPRPPCYCLSGSSRTWKTPKFRRQERKHSRSDTRNQFVWTYAASPCCAQRWQEISLFSFHYIPRVGTGESQPPIGSEVITWHHPPHIEFCKSQVYLVCTSNKLWSPSGPLVTHGRSTWHTVLRSQELEANVQYVKYKSKVAEVRIKLCSMPKKLESKFVYTSICNLLRLLQALA